MRRRQSAGPRPLTASRDIRRRARREHQKNIGRQLDRDRVHGVRARHVDRRFCLAAHHHFPPVLAELHPELARLGRRRRIRRVECPAQPACIDFPTHRFRAALEVGQGHHEVGLVLHGAGPSPERDNPPGPRLAARQSAPSFARWSQERARASRTFGSHILGVAGRSARHRNCPSLCAFRQSTPSDCPCKPKNTKSAWLKPHSQLSSSTAGAYAIEALASSTSRWPHVLERARALA